MGRAKGEPGGEQRSLSRQREGSARGDPRQQVWIAVLLTSLAWLVVGGGALVTWRRPQPVAFAVQPPPATATPQPTATPEPLVVEVRGAVRAVGVYELPHGSRVQNAIAAAGGLAEDADADDIPMARELVDGERVLVPIRAEAKPAVAAQGEPEPAGDGRASAGFPVRINTASVAELEELPGIGPKTAQAIVDYRSTHGSFASVEDILEVKGIGEVTLERIRGLITLE